MKKKILYSVLILSVLFIVSFITIYAAFTMTHNYEAEINYHEIENATLTNSVEDSKITFNKPGDQINVTYTLINNDSKEYEYYYSFEWDVIDYSDNTYLNMIYVYQNGEYCGMLKDYLVSGILPKKNLPNSEYIFSNETRNTIFTFELHNEASSFPESGLSIEFKIVANMSTTNSQEKVFANSINFDKAITNSNNGGNQTIVLTGNVSMSGFNVNKDMTIDLCGKTMSLTGAVTLSENVNLKIIDSRGGGSVTGEGFIISHETSFVELEAPVSKITKTAYNKNKLIEILTNNYETNNIIYASEDYDLFGYYTVYGLSATSNDVNINNGVVQTATYNTNSVIVINVEGINFEFKYVGNNSEVMSNIINKHLEHMVRFMDPMNGIQVVNDLFLPNAIKEYNATISWHSNNPEILSNDGQVQDQQGSVILTATIKVHDIVIVQDYYVYIIQADNMSKLQYLIARVEQGVTVNEGTEDAYTLSSELRVLNEEKYLPVSGETSVPYHYTLWTDNLDLGIIDIEYSKETMYQYIDLKQVVTSNKVTEASVSLSQVTYSKYAMIGISATFENGEEIESFITLSIELEESDLAYEVFEDVQLQLDQVNVLNNILTTRKDEGVKYERGDFYLPARVDVVELEYVSSNEQLYKVVPILGVDEEGNEIVERYEVQFVDLKYLDISDKRISIACKIIERDPYKEITSKDLYFSVPGAITTNNFKSMYIENGQINTVKIFDMSNQNIKRLFYSIKLQTLQQAQYPYYDKKTENGIVNLVDVTDVSDIYSLGEYILVDDIESVSRLMFEYGRTETILNYYDLEILFEIFRWALLDDSTKITNVRKTAIIKDHIDSNLSWIENDGSSEISDGEMAVILSYGEKYAGFNQIWFGDGSSSSGVVNPLDNNLSDTDLSNIIEALADDKTYVSILKWIVDDVNQGIPINEWLVLIDEKSEYFSTEDKLADQTAKISNQKSIPNELLVLANGEGINVDKNEERVLLYYVLANHPKKYLDFIKEWNTYVTKQSNAGSLIDVLKASKTKSFNLSNGSNSRGDYDCYDPIFTIIHDWAFYVGQESEEVSTLTLKMALGTIDSNLIFDEELEYSRSWYRNAGLTDVNEGEQLTANEWRVISRYLYSLGIREVAGTKIYSKDEESSDQILKILNDNNTETASGLDTLMTVSLKAGFMDLLNTTTITLSNTFLEDIIDEVNKVYTSSYAQNYNKLVNWAKSEVVDAEEEGYSEVKKASWEYILKDEGNTEFLSVLKTNELDVYKIKDCTSNISIDEEDILKHYLKHIVLGSSDINSNLKDILVSLLLPIDTSYAQTNISAGYNDILLFAVEESEEINGIVNASTTLGTSAPKSDEYYDNLSTISAREIEEMIMLKPNNQSYIDAISDAFNAYSITVTLIGDTYTVNVVPIKTGEYDRTLDESEQSSLSVELKKILAEDSNAKYTHITIGQITTSEIDVFRVLTYFVNLYDISFRGTRAVYLFDSNASANSTFSLVANSADNLGKLTMNYCGVSDITPVSSLLNLTHLNLRSNYHYGSYKGLESISELIHLNDLKDKESNEEYTYPKIQYLNVYDTNVTLRRGEVVLGKLYQVNKEAELYMDVYGEEKKYPFNLNSSEEAIYALSLLYELDTISGTFIILPDLVYRNIVTGESSETKSYSIEWTVVVANSLVKISEVAGYTRLDRISNETGQVTISASITVDEVTEIRYFVIDVI